ncbi:hypothetical protein BD779DRAFT_1545394, partial [Infundibulicybe gibba]
MRAERYRVRAAASPYACARLAWSLNEGIPVPACCGYTRRACILYPTTCRRWCPPGIRVDVPLYTNVGAFRVQRGRGLVVSDVLSYRMWACRLLVCKHVVPLYTGALSRGILACRLVTIAFCGGCSVLSHAGAPSCRVWVCHPAACAVASRRAQVHGLGPGV